MMISVSMSSPRVSPGEALTIAEQVLRESGRKGGGKSLLQAVSRVKNGVSPEDADLDAELYDAYQARLLDLCALDFDDLLTEGLKRDVTGLQMCIRDRSLRRRRGPKFQASSDFWETTSPASSSGGRPGPAAWVGSCWTTWQIFNVHME